MQIGLSEHMQHWICIMAWWIMLRNSAIMLCSNAPNCFDYASKMVYYAPIAAHYAQP